jgi:arsenate reductase
MMNHHPPRRGNEQEKLRFAPQLDLHQGSRFDLIRNLEIRQLQIFKYPQCRGQFIHLPRLAGRQIRRLQAPGVVFPFRLAPRIRGGGMGLLGRPGKTLQARPEFAADFFKQQGFHHVQVSLAGQPTPGKVLPVRILYAYKNCDSCRKAAKWLAENQIPHETRAIRESPPTVDELMAALASTHGDLKPLFNTSGNDYRELGLKDRLASMSESEAISLLSQNGNLVKRPFLIGDGTVLIGFNPELWKNALG